MPAIHLRFADLRRSFGRVRVLDGVSGEVASGGLLEITGANGSGKSTLLRCIAGLIAPESGVIEHHEDGRALDSSERRAAIGYVAPDLAFYEELTTLENLDFFARLRRVRRERAAELLDRVGLPADRLAGALSSGMLQRLRWAFALLAEPKLLLLDEPFQNLDAAGEQTGTELLAEHLVHGAAIVANPRSLGLDHVAASLELVL